jgi:hypothetical protein
VNRSLFNANVVLALFVELAALAALAYWGLKVGDSALAKATLAIGALLLAAVLWGLFAAPRARFKIPLAGQLAVKAIVLGGAVLALLATGRTALGVAFGVIAVVNTAAATIWNAHGYKFGK